MADPLFWTSGSDVPRPLRLVSLWLPSFAISAIGSALMAWAAEPILSRGRRTAELEVLLTTPVGARTVVADQWKALQRLLRVARPADAPAGPFSGCST